MCNTHDYQIVSRAKISGTRGDVVRGRSHLDGCVCMGKERSVDARDADFAASSAEAPELFNVSDATTYYVLWTLGEGNHSPIFEQSCFGK